MTFTIVVEGNIGTGKSTLLNTIKARHPDLVDIVTEPIDKWQNCRGSNLLELMYNDAKKNALVFQTFVQLTKVQMHKRPTDKPFRLMERSLMSARYCFIENLFANDYIDSVEYAVLDEWFNHLMIDYKIDQIVYLRTEPTISLKE